MPLADTGASALLTSYLNKTQPTGGNNLTLKLFTNDFTPDDTTITSAFTEAAGGGYTAKELIAGNWTVTISGGIPKGAYPQQIFSFTGALTTNTTVYGWYIIDADNALLASSRFDVPFAPTSSAIILTTPEIRLSKGTPT